MNELSQWSLRDCDTLLWHKASPRKISFTIVGKIAEKPNVSRLGDHKTQKSPDNVLLGRVREQNPTVPCHFLEASLQKESSRVRRDKHTSENTCKFCFCSSSSVRPSAICMTLFFPRKKLGKNTQQTRRSRKWNCTNRLSLHSALTSFSLLFLIFS